ncbi:dermonecrotic toxin domain-containing protein [Pseudomonas sp. MPB23]|uniref:dermonecrotic toxin domain-containing protein n=1 Tax=Pseudomonas sp. MPB23 TaxID=3388490 RepID=UPI003984819B
MPDSPPAALNNRPPSTYELLTQLTSGPTSREVAAVTLRAALKALYPTLDIDPDLAMVVTPDWRIVDDQVVPGPAYATSLTSVLARQTLTPEPVIYLDGEHFLTLQPNAQPPVHLPVKIDAIARMINELSELMLFAFQEQYLKYWNASNGMAGPRWRVFAQSLRKVWNVTTQEGWDEHDCAMARSLFHFPELATRSAQDRYNTHAYLIDIDALQGSQTAHVALMDMAVLIGEHEQGQRILVYSLVNGYEKFDSLEQLGKQLPDRLKMWSNEVSLQWRLYEPPGNFFDSLAGALIALQLEAIGAIDRDERKAINTAAVATPPIAVASVLPVVEDLSNHTLSNIRDIHERLPDWLAQASDLDISTYSRYVIDLAELHTLQHGLCFNDGIAPIREYARDQLQREIRTHAQGASINVEKLAVRIETPVVWGSTFIVPTAPDITRHNVIDLALENLTGLPTGQPSVLYNGGAAPSWLSYTYLKGVIEKLDIGQHYPALIKRTLLEDAVQSKARQTLYTTHLRVQLPLLALQLKIRRQYGVDERGARYVAAVMQDEVPGRRVDGQEIVICPLAFLPTLRPGNEQDVVANMFVIGPKDAAAGPCLLYRPLLEPTLLQYPSRQNLLYAIKHTRPLRDSVLAWLPEAARFNYAQYVFPDKWPSPWTVIRGLVEPQVMVYMSGPITLSDQGLGTDPLAALFKANAEAMVELASRQSVANTQKRWATLRQTGWQIFNATLPFLGRTAGIAAWIWQIMDDLQDIAQQDSPEPDPKGTWTAQVDLLLNLGMALVLHAALRHAPVEKPSEKTGLETESPAVEPAENNLPSPSETVVARQANVPGTELPSQHQGLLNVRGAIPTDRPSLEATLDSFKIDRPAGLEPQVTEPGIYLHLYPRARKWYAVVGARWFEVSVDEGDSVVVIDPKDSTRIGPVLLNNRAGQWFVDTRLRLRGGGFRNRRKAVQTRNASRIDELRRQLNAFDADERGKQSEIASAHASIGDEAGPSTESRRQSFIDKVDARVVDYDVPIRQLRSLAIIDTVPNYQSSMIDYLHKQLLLTRSAINQRLPLFSETLESTVQTLEAVADIDAKAQAETAQAMSDMTADMIRRMEYVETRFRELETLGIEGNKVIQTTQHAMPRLKLRDLKAFRITLARYLCVREGAGEAFETARALIDTIVEAAELPIQSCTQALTDSAIRSLEDRIEVLNSLVDQFAIVDQRLLDLHAEYPEQVQREPLEALRQQIDEFNQQVVRELALLLRESRALEPKPGSSKTASPPKRKIIKTRFNGVVVGEPRAAEAGLVDVKAPLTGKVIATFHEKEPGVWVERASHPSLPRPSQAVDLDVSLNEGDQLLQNEPAATLRTLGHSKKAGRIPVEIEEMFHQYAARMERAVSRIEEALTQRNLTESDRPSAASTNKQLNDAAQHLYELGTTTRISMTKQQPPTAARVEWLFDQGLVSIAKVVTRRRLKGPGKDFLDEYEIRDHQTHNVLWYAHFHYPSAQAAAEEYLAGHLKTREQQKQGGSLQRTGLNDRDQIAIYRSQIGSKLARSLFFDN